MLALAGVLGAVGCAGIGPDEASVEQDISPAAPTGLVANVVSSTRVDLSWNAVTGATNYIILRGTAPGNETSYTSISGASASFVDGHATPGSQICYEVSVYIAGQGVSGPSNEQCVTPPSNTLGTPQNVTATAQSSSRILVTWSAVTGADHYQVWQSTNGGAYAFTSTVTATNYTAVNLTANTPYCYEIVATSSLGSSAFSSPGCDSTLGGNGGLEGWWKLDEDTGTVASDSSGKGHNGTLTGAAAFSNDKPPVADNKSTVLSPGAAGDAVSIPSASAFNLSSDFTVSLWVKLPAAPTGTVHIFGKRAASCGAVTWEIDQDATNGLYFNGTAIRGFGQSLPVGTWTHVAVTRVSGNAATFYINGAPVSSGAVSVGTASSDPLQIGNSGSCGNGGQVLVDEARIYSTALTAQQISDLGTVPPAPTGLTATPVSSTQISLAWNASTNPTKYLIYKGTTSGDEQFYTSSPATSPTFGAGHLSPGTQYSWQVAVVSHGLISNRSTEAIASTNAAPGAPQNVVATAASSTRINVTWSAVTGATKYYVYQSVSGGPYAFKGSVLSPTTSFSAAGLTSGTTYSYEVQAEDSGMTLSPMSAPASATTP